MSFYSDATIWGIIVLLGLGTWALRFSFLGLIGAQALPEWVLRHLRYTAVGVLPGLVAPLVVWPEATGGIPDPARIAAALATVGVGLLSRNMIASVVAGMATLYVVQALAG